MIEIIPENIIFLDVDGVFNCQLFYESKQFLKFSKRKNISHHKLNYYDGSICRERIKWFNGLCESTNSKVVISASMRAGKTVEELQRIFDYCGGTFKIIGLTGHDNSRLRGVEIHQWLVENIKKETHGCLYFDFYRYAIIDDDADMMLDQAFNFFQTDNYAGLNPDICYRIKRFLTHKTF